MIDNIPAIYKDENGTYNVGFPIGYKSSIVKFFLHYKICIIIIFLFIECRKRHILHL